MLLCMVFFVVVCNAVLWYYVMGGEVWFDLWYGVVFYFMVHCVISCGMMWFVVV